MNELLLMADAVLFIMQLLIIALLIRKGETK